MKELFETRYRITLESVATRENERRPDFSGRVDGNQVFVAELKTIIHQDVTLDNGFELTHDTTYPIMFGTRTDNALNKIGNIIEDAASQLKSFECPKILIIQNLSYLDFDDVKHVVDGFLIYGSESGESEFIDRSGILQYRARWAMQSIDIITFVDEAKSFIGHKYLNDVGKFICRNYFNLQV